MSDDSWLDHLSILEDWLSNDLDGSSWNLLDLSDDGKSSLGVEDLESDLDQSLEVSEDSGVADLLDGDLALKVSVGDHTWSLDEVDLLALEVSGAKSWQLDDLERFSRGSVLDEV